MSPVHIDDRTFVSALIIEYIYGYFKIMTVFIIVFFQDLYQVVLPYHVFEGLYGGRT